MKLIRFAILTTELFLCFVLQNIVMVNLPAGNIIPDMMLVIVCGMAYMFGSTAGTVYGFIAGLLTDISSGSLGFASFMLAASGYLCGYSRKFYSRSNEVIPLALVAVTEFAYLSLYYIANFMTRGRSSYLFMVKSIIMPRVTLTVLVGVILYKLCSLSVMFTKTEK